MVAPEAISPLARYAALVAEVPVIRLAEPDARELGLRDGQVVQALAQAQGDSLFFELGGKRFDIPPGWQRLAPGDMRWFRVQRQGDAFVLRSTAPPAAAATTALSGSSEGAPASVAVASGVLLSELPATPSQRLLALFSRPSGFSALAQILSPGRLESALIDVGAPHLARELVAARLRSDALTPEAIQRAVANSGIWGEALLAAGRQAGHFDLKAFLRQISKVLGSKSAATAAEVDDAVDDIERKQIESLQQSTDGRLVFSVMLPFADSPAASLRFERHGLGDHRGHGGYTIDLHIVPPSLGDLWMKTTVVGTRVDVTVWTRRADVAALVGTSAGNLDLDLREAGLSLRAFNVLNGERPELASPVEMPRSGGLDMKA